jgi:hypothetical protein
MLDNSARFMQSSAFMKTTLLPLKRSINLSPVRLALLLFPLALLCFGLSPQARATCQEGCNLNLNNTFLGNDALLSDKQRRLSNMSVQFIDDRKILRNKTRLENQILRRISSDRQLRRQHEFRACCREPLVRTGDQFAVSSQIADRRINLSETNLHALQQSMRDALTGKSLACSEFRLKAACLRERMQKRINAELQAEARKGRTADVRNCTFKWSAHPNPCHNHSPDTPAKYVLLHSCLFARDILSHCSNANPSSISHTGVKPDCDEYN